MGLPLLALLQATIHTITAVSLNSTTLGTTDSATACCLWGYAKRLCPTYPCLKYFICPVLVRNCLTHLSLGSLGSPLIQFMHKKLIYLFVCLLYILFIPCVLFNMKAQVNFLWPTCPPSASKTSSMERVVSGRAFWPSCLMDGSSMPEDVVSPEKQPTKQLVTTSILTKVQRLTW